MKLKIGELAKKSGCPVVTIRYYEKEGLLPEPDRSGSNYRLYDEADMERLRFIRHCRRHGMKLAEIRELLAFRDHPTRSCDWINTLVQRHIDNVEAQIASLTQLKAQLEQLLHACSGGSAGRCGILESLPVSTTSRVFLPLLRGSALPRNASGTGQAGRAGQGPFQKILKTRRRREKRDKPGTGRPIRRRVPGAWPEAHGARRRRRFQGRRSAGRYRGSCP